MDFLDDIKLPPLDTVTVIDGILCDELTGEPVELLPNVIPAPPPAEGVTLDYLHAFLDCCDISEEARQDAHDRAKELLELHRKQTRRNARRDARCKQFDSGLYNDILRGYVVLACEAAGMDPEPLLDVLPRVLDDYTAREALQA